MTNVIDGRTGLPMVCHVCAEPTGMMTNMATDNCGPDVRPVCWAHSGLAGFGDLDQEAALTSAYLAGVAAERERAAKVVEDAGDVSGEEDDWKRIVAARVREG